jgi:hypothetical protein
VNPGTPEGYNAQVLSELREQSRLLKGIDEKVSVLVEHLGAMRTPSASNGEASKPKKVADDFDLDGQYGNPPVRKDPPAKYWSGESYAGMRFSECPAEYLEALGRYLDSCAYMKRTKPKDDKDIKYAEYDEMNAARARGWAQRNKNAPPPVPKESNGAVDSFDDDSVPF